MHLSPRCAAIRLAWPLPHLKQNWTTNNLYLGQSRLVNAMRKQGMRKQNVIVPFLQAVSGHTHVVFRHHSAFMVCWILNPCPSTSTARSLFAEIAQGGCYREARNWWILWRSDISDRESGRCQPFRPRSSLYSLKVTMLYRKSDMRGPLWAPGWSCKQELLNSKEQNLLINKFRRHHFSHPLIGNVMGLPWLFCYSQFNALSCELPRVFAIT